MTDHIDLAGESPGPDRAPGQGGRRWSTWTVPVVLLLTAGVLLLLLVYIGRSRPESA